MGTLQVPTSADLPPIEFYAPDNKTITGMDIDLGNAIAQHLGLKFDFVNTGFDTIIPSLQAGKYQIAMAGIIDTPAREKVVQIVPYFRDSVNFLVKADSPGFESLADLCGHTVGVQSGSAFVEIAKKQDQKCKSEGKPGVSVEVFNKQTDANLAVSSGRVDATINDAPLNGYQAKQSNGTLKTSGTPFGEQDWGIALPKDSKFGPAIVAALKEMMNSGEYQQILKKWGAPPSGGDVKPTVKGG